MEYLSTKGARELGEGPAQTLQTISRESSALVAKVSSNFQFSEMGGGFLRAFPNLYAACCILKVPMSSHPLPRRWGWGDTPAGRRKFSFEVKTEPCWDVLGVGLRVVNGLLALRDLVLGEK